MSSQQAIISPAGYVPQFAMAFGEANANAVSRDQPLPVRAGGRSLAERLAVEGTQATNSYVRGDNSGTAYSVGHVLGYFSPPIGRAAWIESITVSATKDVAIRIQRLDSALNANSAGPGIYEVLVGPGYGGTVTIPVQGFLNEGESYSFILRTAVPQSGSADFSYFCGLHARHVTNDFFIDAPRTLLVIGDSISTTTMPGSVANGQSFYHARIAARLRAEGRGVRRVVKGDGGWRMSHAVKAMHRGQLESASVDALMVMLGTNDTIAADFRENLAELIAWKQASAPQIPMVVIGPPTRLDSAEAAYLQPIRSEAQAVIAGVGDPLVEYIDTSSAFAADADMLPDQIHLSATAHEALADHVEAQLKASGTWSLF